MQRCLIIFDSLLPTSQNPTEAIHPAGRSLHNPVAGFKSRVLDDAANLLDVNYFCRYASTILASV